MPHKNLLNDVVEVLNQQILYEDDLESFPPDIVTLKLIHKRLQVFIDDVPDMSKPNPMSEFNAFDFADGGVIHSCLIDSAKLLNQAIGGNDGQ